MEEVIPERLLNIAERSTFLAWLRGLPFDPEDKKQLLSIWADRVGTKVTGDMLKSARIERR